MIDKPTMPERYARAMESSHLEMSNERAGDVDLLIAAGWVKEGLGTMLYRLRVEFDSVNQLELRKADQLTARVLTLMKLRTLPSAREALWVFAVRHATRVKFMVSNKAVGQIMGQALDAWLDPLCHTCDGRGFTGGSGKAIVLCTVCHGSGRRTLMLGKSPEGHEFGRGLMNEMDRKTQYVSSRMRTYMGNRSET